MSEWRKLSRLPESPDYWMGLRERIDHAAQPLLFPHSARDAWLNAILATASLAAVVVIGLLIVQPTTTSTATRLRSNLAPADPLALELLNSQQPPHISGLLPAYTPRSAQ
jgi:hypothetical protein